MNKRDIWREMTAGGLNRFLFRVLPPFLFAYALVASLLAGIWAGLTALFITLLGLGLPFFFEWKWAAERLREEEEETAEAGDDREAYGPSAGHQRYNPMDDW